MSVETEHARIIDALRKAGLAFPATEAWVLLAISPRAYLLLHPCYAWLDHRCSRYIQLPVPLADLVRLLDELAVAPLAPPGLLALTRPVGQAHWALEQLAAETDANLRQVRHTALRAFCEQHWPGWWTELLEASAIPTTLASRCGEVAAFAALREVTTSTEALVSGPLARAVLNASLARQGRPSGTVEMSWAEPFAALLAQAIETVNRQGAGDDERGAAVLRRVREAAKAVALARRLTDRRDSSALEAKLTALGRLLIELAADAMALREWLRSGTGVTWSPT